MFYITLERSRKLGKEGEESDGMVISLLLPKPQPQEPQIGLYAAQCNSCPTSWHFCQGIENDSQKLYCYTILTIVLSFSVYKKVYGFCHKLLKI